MSDGIGDLYWPPPARSPQRRLVGRIVKRKIPRSPATTVLYRYFDDLDRLLYVGVTHRLTVRILQHVGSSIWTGFAVRATFERFPTRTEAELAEQTAIAEENPLFNARPGGDPEAERQLVRYLIKRGRADLLVPNMRPA